METWKKLHTTVKRKQGDAVHMESPGTKAFTVREVCAMFKDLEKLHVETVVTPYDLRIGRRLFFSSFVRRFVPKQIGFNLLLQGCKPLADKRA